MNNENIHNHKNKEEQDICQVCIMAMPAKTSEQVCEHGDKSEQMSKHAGAHCLCPVRKIEPLPDLDDSIRESVNSSKKISDLLNINMYIDRTLWNKVNELIEAHNKN